MYKSRPLNAPYELATALTSRTPHGALAATLNIALTQGTNHVVSCTHVPCVCPIVQLFLKFFHSGYTADARLLQKATSLPSRFHLVHFLFPLLIRPANTMQRATRFAPARRLLAVQSTLRVRGFASSLSLRE